MKIIESSLVAGIELPLQLNISFQKVFVMFKKYALKENENHPFHNSSKEIVCQLEKYPELIHGFSDYSLLEKYKKQINLLLTPLFPEPLLNNEIKAVCIPFSFTSFKFTSRFEKIIENAGEDYEFQVRNFQD
ncbi:MAG: GAF domain-containing protein, partial [Polaribacter sp.]